MQRAGPSALGEGDLLAVCTAFPCGSPPGRGTGLSLQQKGSSPETHGPGHPCCPVNAVLGEDAGTTLAP